MNESKIAFIICVNNELYFNECNFYIQRLHVPNQMEVEVIGIREADSMCAAYNLGMNSTDAKYKIYMHQDVFIKNKDFLSEIINRFKEDASVGMIGMVGGVGMPKTGVTYLAWNRGIVECREPDLAYYLVCQKERIEDSYVDAVDGLLIATQYDVKWREDIFKDFDFYDISQSFEMRKQGYRILVPAQDNPWVIHDSSFAKLPYYDKNREICIKEYTEYLTEDDGFEFTYNEEWEQLSDALAGQLCELINAGNWELVSQIIAQYRQKNMKNSKLEMYGIMSDIVMAEKRSYGKNIFFENMYEEETITEHYKIVRLLLRRVEEQMEEDCIEELKDAVKSGNVTAEALIRLIVSSTVEKKKVCRIIKKWFSEFGFQAEKNKMQMLENKLSDKLPLAYSKRIAVDERL